MEVVNALINLSTRMIIISLSLVQKIGDLKIEKTIIKLHMADKIYRKPVGAIKDVSIKIDSFSLHVDFMVLDIEGDQKISLILG